MGVLEDLADKLAQDALEAAEKLGDEDLINDIAKQLGASSTTMEETYMTSIRIRSAEIRARRHLKDRIKTAVAAKKAEKG